MSIKLLGLDIKISKKISVKIDKDKSIFELKESFKAKNQNGFAGIDADRLKLWKVEIPFRTNCSQ